MGAAVKPAWQPVLESLSGTDGLALAHELAVRCDEVLKVTYVAPERELITVFLASPGGLTPLLQ